MHSMRQFYVYLLIILAFLSSCSDRFEIHETETFQAPVLKSYISGIEHGMETSVDAAPRSVSQLPRLPFSIGDRFMDVKAKRIDGSEWKLRDILAEGQMVLLVGGSASLPEFRSDVKSLNKWSRDFAGQIEVVQIYTREAYPLDAVSEFSGGQHYYQPEENQKAEISFPLDRTLEIRKQNALASLKVLNTHCEVLLDGPSNPFLKLSEGAPNAAFLIHPKGHLLAFHQWLDPEFMEPTLVQSLRL